MNAERRCAVAREHTVKAASPVQDPARHFSRVRFHKTAFADSRRPYHNNCTTSLRPAASAQRDLWKSPRTALNAQAPRCPRLDLVVPTAMPLPARGVPAPCRWAPEHDAQRGGMAVRSSLVQLWPILGSRVIPSADAKHRLFLRSLDAARERADLPTTAPSKRPAGLRGNVSSFPGFHAIHSPCARNCAFV